MIIKTLAAGLAAAVTAVASAQAAVFLEQVGTLDATKVSAFDFDGTAAEAYAFGNPVDYSYNGDTVNGLPAAEDGVAKLFLVDTTDGLALFGIFDAVNDGSGGNQDSTWRYFEGGGSDSLIVRDDNDGNDFYDEINNGYHLDHQWNACCTDGFVFDLSADSFDLLGELLEGGNGLDSLVFVQADGTEIDLELNDAFSIYTGEVPLPAALPLGAVGFAGMMGVARRRRKS